MSGFGTSRSEHGSIKREKRPNKFKGSSASSEFDLVSVEGQTRKLFKSQKLGKFMEKLRAEQNQNQIKQ